MYFLSVKSIAAGLHDTTVWTFGIATATHRGIVSIAQRQAYMSIDIYVSIDILVRNTTGSCRPVT